MALQKWYKKGLQYMGTQGYKVIPCDTEEEAIEIKEYLKQNKRCAQAGYVINRENKTIYFVLTKNKNNTPLENPMNVNGGSKTLYNL